MNLESIRAAEARLLLPTYERYPIQFVSGHGVFLTDEHGQDYLDLLSGIGVNALGYGHPAIEAAIADQSKRLLHTSNLFFHPGQAELALRLTEMTGLDRAFFANTGTEAWEAALKLARAWSTLRRSEGVPMGTRILAIEHGFHGRTMGSVSTTHKSKYREPFEPLIPGVAFVRFDDIADLEAKFSAGSGTEDCAICIEAVQGEGGIRPVSPEFFAAARRLTQSTGALLIADEIQAGLGRTGRWCAYQHYGILPDVTTLAKPLAGGLPLGVMLCTDAVARAITPGMHGTTFGGGPLACAVAIAVIDTLRRERILDHVQSVGEYFQQQLRALARRHAAFIPGAEVRGLGLMLCLDVQSEPIARQVHADMMERRILLNRTSETVLRFLPPFILQREHVDQTIAALDAVFTILAAAAGPQVQYQLQREKALHGQ